MTKAGSCEQPNIRLLEWMFRQELAGDSRGGETVPDSTERLVTALK